jgi:hypothetical protein
VGLIKSVPKIQRPQRAKGSMVMKGRPDYDGGVRVPLIVNLIERHS